MDYDNKKSLWKWILLYVVIGVIAYGIIYYFFFYNNQTENQNYSINVNQGMENSNNDTSEKLNIQIEKEGSGEAAKNGDKITVNYVGTLENGTKFDSSYDRNEPIVFQLGGGQVIQGWDLGILGMKVGEKRKLTIAPELGYGSSPVGNIIPANSTLIFEVELLKIN